MRGCIPVCLRFQLRERGLCIAKTVVLQSAFGTGKKLTQWAADDDVLCGRGLLQLGQRFCADEKSREPIAVINPIRSLGKGLCELASQSELSSLLTADRLD